MKGREKLSSGFVWADGLFQVNSRHSLPVNSEFTDITLSDQSKPLGSYHHLAALTQVAVII